MKFRKEDIGRVKRNGLIGVREQKAAYMWRTWGHQREPSCPGEEVTSADDRYFSTMLDHWLTVNDGVLFGYFCAHTFSLSYSNVQ